MEVIKGENTKWNPAMIFSILDISTGRLCNLHQNILGQTVVIVKNQVKIKYNLEIVSSISGKNDITAIGK